MLLLAIRKCDQPSVAAVVGHAVPLRRGQAGQPVVRRLAGECSVFSSTSHGARERLVAST